MLNFFEASNIMAIGASSIKMEVKEVKNVQLISNQACDPLKFKTIPKIAYKQTLTELCHKSLPIFS